MSAEPLVGLEAVTKEYGAGTAVVHALLDVTLTLPQRELCVVHGRSGSGKTTLLNMIGGLDRPSRGRVEVLGLEVSSLREEALIEYRRDTVGFVFQSFGLIPILSAAENVEVPLRLRHVDPAERAARVRELLDIVDLGDRANHRPQELSGGEQQRVAIARALVGQRPLLLADEPTGALDTLAGEAILGLLRARCDAGVAAVLVTHEPRYAGYADRIVFLTDGRVVDQTAHPTTVAGRWS